MKNLKFDIVNIEEFSGQKAQIYSIMFEGDDMTLMDHFFEDFSGEYQEDLDEMPFIFIGSGGYKSPDIKAYQEDPVLYSKVLDMRKIAVCINKAIKDRELRIREDGTLDISYLIELEI